MSNGDKVLPTQGGFILVKPDMEVYEKLCDVVRKVRAVCVCVCVCVSGCCRSDVVE